MHELSNNVLILIPTGRMLSWLNQSVGEPLALHEIAEDPAAIVVPELETKEELEAFLRTHWQEIFESQLEAWSSEHDWPQKRTCELFREFLQIKTCSIVYEISTDDSGAHFGFN